MPKQIPFAGLQFEEDPIAPSDDQPTSKKVPNLFPSISLPSQRIAIVGEAPGKDEEQLGIPFIGMSGQFLDRMLSKFNILRASCLIGNVCQYRPPRNEISEFSKDGPEIREGLTQLSTDIERFNPNLCLLLGKTALWAAKDKASIDDWRGSFFISDKPGPFFGRKCLATYHPARCLRQYECTPLVMFDIRKVVADAGTPILTLPRRELIIDLTHANLCYELERILDRKPPIASDIEGGINSLSCIGIATSASRAFLVPFLTLDNQPCWSIDEEMELWKLVAVIMADREIPKCWQNGLYDRFVLQYSYNILVRNNADDIMLKHWELYCELEKSLAVQASIYTQEPFYKFERKTTDQETFYKYCCKDAALTFEINEKLERMLDDDQKAHYHRNNAILNALLYAELRGIRYDEKLAKERLVEIETSVYGFQNQLDELAESLGALQRIDFNKPNSEILDQVQSICGYVRDKTTPKAKFVKDGYWEAIRPLQFEARLTAEQQGEISVMCGTTLNTKSYHKLQSFLYGTCGLPTQWKEDPTTKEMKVTTDYESLLKLTKNHDHPALQVCLELSRLRTRMQMLAIRSLKGRMHCSYNLVGSETGRVTSSKSILSGGLGKRVGANLQTVPDDWDLEDKDHPLTQGMRDLFLADEGCYLGKCDLKGADGWTVGSYMAMLGDSTMLDDLKFGLKPAQIVAYILKHGPEKVQENANNRQALKDLCSEIKKEDWEYFVSKQGFWGSCYTMGPRKLADRILIESDGKVNLTEKQAKAFQACIYVRYDLKLLHNWMQNFLTSQPYPAKLTATNGFTRKFFGRNFKQRMEILGDALAHLPQVYTTHATLLALYRLWTDPSNRIPKDGSSSACSLKVQILHQVHDELLLQWKKKDTEWAIDKTKQWFNNPVAIANQSVVIPFDGAYGTAWSMDEMHKVGEVK